MNRGMKRIWAVLFLTILLAIVPAGSVMAEIIPENGVASEVPATENEALADGQETIEDEEVPLAEPNVNTTAFMWCGIVMVVVLASITGYASFGKEATVRK